MVEWIFYPNYLGIINNTGYESIIFSLPTLHHYLHGHFSIYTSGQRAI